MLKVWTHIISLSLIRDLKFHFFISPFSALVSKVEKKLADQTDFFNYKNEMDSWIAKALEVLESCSVKGNVDDIKQQMETVNVSHHN